MFSEADNPTFWDLASNQVKCYTHKIGLLVKAGLKSLGLRAGNVKPTTSPGGTLPTPTMTLNEEDEDFQFDFSKDKQEDLNPDEERLDCTSDRDSETGKEDSGG